MQRRVLLVIVTAALLGEIASCGGSGSPPPPAVTVTVSTTSTSVPVNGEAFFSAVVNNATNQAVTWSVNGGAANGSINSNGLYTAPSGVPNPATITVTAVPQADTSISGQASITVTVQVSVSPSSAAVQTLGTTQFTASVQGSSNQSVSWQVNGVSGGNASVGTISANGVYQAPESVPVNASAGQTTQVDIEATAAAGGSATAVATITSANQLSQNLPIELGTSGGNINNIDTTECASGTLGSLVTRDGSQYILSNNHVLADSDAGTIGDAITQPGLIDTPSPCDAAQTTTVAHLSQFINIQQQNPPADAAIAQIVSGAVNTSGTIIQLGDSTNGSGVPTDEAPASTILPVTSLVPNSTAVAKSGRSTGLTCALVESTDMNVSVQYTEGLSGQSFTAEYADQIAVGSGTFSAAGDSGSLIVSQAGAQPVALLYAGSSTETVGAPAQTVLNNLGDTSSPPNIPSFVGPASRNAVAGCTSSGTDSFDATAQSAAPQLSSAQLAQAEAAKNQNASTLLSDPAVLAVGVAPSLDRTDRAAVVLFVRKGEPLVRAIPPTVSGVPTRVVAVNSVSQSGVLTQDATATQIKNSGVAQPSVHPTPQQLAAAKAVKDKYSSSLMKQPGILGVGVTSSLDNPSDAAIMIYVETGKPHNPIPLSLDGIRVRVKSTDKFRAYGWGHPTHRS